MSTQKLKSISEGKRLRDFGVLFGLIFAGPQRFDLIRLSLRWLIRGDLEVPPGVLFFQSLRSKRVIFKVFNQKELRISMLRSFVTLSSLAC